MLVDYGEQPIIVTKGLLYTSTCTIEIHCVPSGAPDYPGGATPLTKGLAEDLNNYCESLIISVLIDLAIFNSDLIFTTNIVVR